jgi:hypothetical protein
MILRNGAQFKQVPMELLMGDVGWLGETELAAMHS